MLYELAITAEIGQYVYWQCESYCRTKLEQVAVNVADSYSM